MAIPNFEDLPADTWTKVATNVTQGQVHLVEKVSVMLCTYIQPTGDPVPIDDPALGVPVFVKDTTEPINFTAGADVYLRPVGVDSRVRVDIG